MESNKKMVVSSQRVAEHGEVYTAKGEVNAMLDLVKQETDRIDSRFLEPACGTGNFLIEIMERKLTEVANRYSKSQIEYERYTVIAVSSIYGIDILEDNVESCRERLWEIFLARYRALFKDKVKEACLKSVRFILELNIVHGDALTLQTMSMPPESIVFAEWSAVNGNMIKRRDFTFKELISHADLQSLPLFSDLGDDVFIPTPLKDYPLIHFLKVANAY